MINYDSEAREYIEDLNFKLPEPKQFGISEYDISQYLRLYKILINKTHSYPMGLFLLTILIMLTIYVSLALLIEHLLHLNLILFYFGIGVPLFIYLIGGTHEAFCRYFRKWKDNLIKEKIREINKTPSIKFEGYFLWLKLKNYEIRQIERWVDLIFLYDRQKRILLDIIIVKLEHDNKRPT